MQEKNERRMHLPTIDSYFSTQQERDNEKLEKIVNIDINQIDDFPNHPFKVLQNDEMNEMVESIKDKGVLVPTIVRMKSDGRYEMISGHRRKYASEIAGMDTIPSIVRNLTDDEATIIMVDSNLQREKILPSEKAFAYKMKLEAMKRSAGRPKNNSVPVAHNFNGKTTRQIIGEQVGESQDQVRRYIRLTHLIPKLLEYVDNDAVKAKDVPGIALRPAVEISYLTEEEQKHLQDYIEFNEITPSQSQAIKLREMSENNRFSVDLMEELMDEEKPNQIPKLKVSMNRLNSVLPKTLRNDREREEYVIKAVEFYDKYQKRMKEKQKNER